MEEIMIEIDKIELIQDSRMDYLRRQINEKIDIYKKDNYTCIGSDTTQIVTSSSATIYTTVTLKFKKNC